MLDRATLFGLAASVAGLIFVLELVRQRKLREDYSLLWLATTIILIVLSVSRPLLDVLARAARRRHLPARRAVSGGDHLHAVHPAALLDGADAARAREQGDRAADGDSALGTERSARAARFRR